MSIFTRRVVPPTKRHAYRKYQPLVREDFCECCAYCLLHEIIAGGEDNFELDHFQPKSIKVRGIDLNDFFNLYYACHVCNHYKSKSWPSDVLLASGYRYVDPCAEDFTVHFLAEPSGKWNALTRPGEYTEARLRLNRRHLLEVRALLNEIAELQGRPLINWGQPAKTQIAEILGVSK